MPITNQILRTRNSTISLLDTGGPGFPVLMIHGSGSSKEVFRRQLHSPLGRDIRMIAVDLPGHGQSSDASNPIADYSIRGLAQSMSDLIEALEIDRLAVFGWSLGGHVAIELLASAPAVAGLMLSGTPPISPGPLGMLRGFQTHWDLLLASKENFSEHDTARFYALCFGDQGEPEMLEALRRADGRLRPIVVRSMMRGDGVDQKNVIERAGVPIAIVNGSDEPFARLSYLAGLGCSMLWRGQCHLIPDAGHAPFWERPDLFNPLLAEFARDVEKFQAAGLQPLARTA